MADGSSFDEDPELHEEAEAERQKHQQSTGGGAAPYRLLSVADLKNQRPPPWLIEDIITQDSVVVLYGKPGIGKGFVALSMALSIATGVQWCGRSVSAGVALYVTFEGVGGLELRISVWQQHVGLTDDEEIGQLRFLADALPFANANERRRLLATIDAFPEPPKLIVIDTYARALVGDENSAKDVNDFIKFIDALRIKTKAALILIHHSGKDDERGERGSTALRGAADTVLRLVADIGGLSLTMEKQRNAELSAPLGLARETVQLPDGRSSCVIVGHTVTVNIGNLVKLTPAERNVLEALNSADPDGVTATEWRMATGMPESTFHRHRRELVKRGLVGRPGQSGKGERYTLTDRGREALGPQPDAPVRS